MSGPVEVAGDQLRTIVERIEKVEEELKELSEAKKCQIAFNCDPSFASNNDPASVRNGRAETGGA
jgi:Uncharacterized protein conserved in bacteria (DUF2312)